MIISTQTPQVSPIIRLLTAADADAYRAVRRRILEIGDGCYFSDSYMREKQLGTKSAWQEWCTERPDHCIFGTFINNELVGVMMITQYDAFGDDTVEWEAIWLDQRFRKQGLAKLAYDHVWRWTLDQGYDRVALFIRADNLRSLYIHQKLGARYISTKRNEAWADGSIADVHAFLLDLREPVRQIVRRVENTLVFLKQELRGPTACEMELLQRTVR